MSHERETLLDALVESARAEGHHSTLRESSDDTVAYWTARTKELRARLRSPDAAGGFLTSDMRMELSKWRSDLGHGVCEQGGMIDRANTLLGAIFVADMLVSATPGPQADTLLSDALDALLAVSPYNLQDCWCREPDHGGPAKPHTPACVLARTTVRALRAQIKASGREPGGKAGGSGETPDGENLRGGTALRSGPADPPKPVGPATRAELSTWTESVALAFKAVSQQRAQMVVLAAPFPVYNGCPVVMKALGQPEHIRDMLEQAVASDDDPTIQRIN